MDENHRIRGIFTVCKFIVNASYDVRNQNRIITKTLGKFGVVDTDYQGPSPNHDEFWLCKIVKEIKAGTPKGCIVLTPIMRLERNQIKSLIPNTGRSTEFVEDGICYVTPTNPNGYYLIPLEYRKSNKEFRVTLCVNQGLLPSLPVSVVEADAEQYQPHTEGRNPYKPRPLHEDSASSYPSTSHGWNDEAIRERYKL